MPTIPGIAQAIEPAKNPMIQPSQSDLLMAAASMPTQSDAAKTLGKRKPKGKGK